MRIVMKFGGTAINSPEKIIHVANIIKSQKKKADTQIVCVVSAIRGMTDGIVSISAAIKKGDKVFIADFLREARENHLHLVQEAIKDSKLQTEAREAITTLLDELEDILDGIVLLAEVTAKSLDYLMSFGERLSAPIISFALRDKGVSSEYLTGKEAGILTDSNFGEARPLMDTTKLRLEHKLEPLLEKDIVPVITGFIGADQNGNVTTIGRGGSDYTATIIGAGIEADEVWFWSDVNGLMTADPKIVDDATVIKEVSFSEAMEMALFGAKYMHP